MSFVEMVKLVRKYVNDSNMWKKLQMIFGHENIRKAKNSLKNHVRVAKLSDEILELLEAIEKGWTGKNPFGQCTMRDCLWMEDLDLKQALLLLKDSGEKAYREFVRQKKNERDDSSSLEDGTDVAVVGSSAEAEVVLADNTEKLKKKCAELEKLVKTLEAEKKQLQQELSDKKQSKAMVKVEHRSSQTLDEESCGGEKRKRTQTPKNDEKKKQKITLTDIEETFEVGERVWAYYKKDKRSYPAIVKNKSDNRYKVEYEEDGITETLQISHLTKWHSGLHVAV